MELLRWKVRLAVLWVLLGAGLAVALCLSILAPGAINGLMTGKIAGTTISGGLLVMWTLLFIIPAAMAILSLTLNQSLNRWLNFVLGIVFGLFYIFDLISHAAKGSGSVPFWLMIIAGIVFTALIAWFAWRWPKKEA